jgi:hypothetical protein
MDISPGPFVGVRAWSCLSARTFAPWISRKCRNPLTSPWWTYRSSHSWRFCRASPSCCAPPKENPSSHWSSRNSKPAASTSAKARLGTVAKIRTRATDHGFLAGDFVESPITGPAGNVEYLLLLRTKYNAATLVQATEQSPVPRNASADWGSSVAKRTLPIRGHCRLKGSPATGQRAVTTIVSRGYGWRVLDLPRRRAGGVRFTDLRGLTASRRS